METLKNLNQLYNDAAYRFEKYDGKDFMLPQAFKEYVPEISHNKITYNDYSAVIATSTGQNIYLPNQWFYIASYFTEFYNELMKYKNEALKIVSKERLKELDGQDLTTAELSKLSALPIDEESKEYLTKFITDYSWWGGAKTIDRGDFFVSPILNSAKLVNASQSFVADLCAFLADKEDLVKAIISGEDRPTTIKKELLRQKAAATFMKKAMRITLSKDNNFSLLAALNKYKKTSVQLQINGFNLGRDKNLLPKRIDDVDVDIAWIYDSQEYVLYLEWTQEMMEQLFFPVYNEAYQGMLKMEKAPSGDYVLYEVNVAQSYKGINHEPLQQIFYGAPGTGKSHKVNEATSLQPQKNLFRTTFHPDSDYSSFVGCYKPTMKVVPKTTLIGTKVVEVENGTPDEKIVYRFVPQAFTNAYIKAWTTKEDVYLIIEEINRGNCAQIFGDLFQLLDRNDTGESEYPIEADTDLGNYIAEKLADSARTDFPDGVKEGLKLVLPSNLYIWATMNTSDQSLFPIDSAFKRRWDWQYVPIDTAKETWYIQIGDNRYSWTDFLNKVNNELLTDETAEDKHLGFYFCKADNNVISQEKFVAKVLFYLWTDVFKVYGIPAAIGSSKEWAYANFYNADGSVSEEKVRQLMANIGVEPVLEQDDEEEDDDNIPQSQRKESLISIQIPGQPIINSSDSTQFDAFLKALSQIGVEKVISQIDQLKYTRKGSPILSLNKDPMIENDSVYSYGQTGRLFVIKGAKSYTYVRILEDLDKLLHIGLTLETK